MKLSVLQENLARALGIVGLAVAARSTIPITTHVVLETDESRLRMRAFDMNIAISCWISASVESEGSLTVPGRLFTDFVSSLQPDRIDFEVDDVAHQWTVSSGRDNARISGEDVAEFPSIPTVSDAVTVQLPPDLLGKAIDRVAIAAAKDDARPVLTGIHASIEGDVLTLAAADGFRLAVQTIQLPAGVDDKIEAIIPARTLRELRRLLTDEQEPVVMSVAGDKKHVLFRLASVEIVSALLEGTFPNYRQLIPENYSTRTVVDVQELLRAARIAGVMAHDGNGIIRLYITPGAEGMGGTVRLTSRSEEVGGVEESVDARVEGEEAHIAFNGRYLTDVLDVVDNTVMVDVSNPSSPGTIRPAEGDDGYIHVVMPMFVQW